MLAVLKIKNIAIIESAEIEFSRGFNVLTGETGAGKSIILDSINAVLGFRTSRELIRTGASEAEVSALFVNISSRVSEKLASLSLPDNGDGELLVSRVIGAERNICRVNGALTTVSVLRELGKELISIHGQQDNHELLDNGTHLSYIDAVAQTEGILDDFSKSYRELSEADALIKKLSTDSAERERRADMLAFQIDELEKADISVGEWQSLKERREILENYERISETYNNAYSALSGDGETPGALSMISGAMRELSSVSGISKEADELCSQITDAYYALCDAADSLRDVFSDDAPSQNELAEVEERLDLLYRLSRKYGEDEEAMLEFLDNARAELSSVCVSDETLAALKVKREKLYKTASDKALKLSKVRRKAAKAMSAAVCDELKFLDMPNVQFFAEFTDVELCESGIDSAEFMISANVGEVPKPIAKTASGGELSRIMLALKNVLSDNDKIGTMIFDEIDSGVSGRAASKVARKLKSVSKGRQVICVTHLAQLAAFADSHYLIEKAVRDGKTFTSVTLLEKEGRKNEIARINGDGVVTKLQLDYAEEMLESAASAEI